MSVVVVETKACCGCGCVFPVDAFPVKRRWPDGTVRYRKARCRSCTRDQERAAKQRMLRPPAAVCPVDVERPVYLPVGPLREAVKHAIRRRSMQLGMWDEKLSTGEICKRCGIRDRLWRDWKAGTSRRVTLDVADRVMLGLGVLWWEVWDPQEFPEVAKVFEPEEVAA